MHQFQSDNQFHLLYFSLHISNSFLADAMSKNRYCRRHHHYTATSSRLIQYCVVSSYYHYQYHSNMTQMMIWMCCDYEMNSEMTRLQIVVQYWIVRIYSSSRGSESHRVVGSEKLLITGSIPTYSPTTHHGVHIICKQIPLFYSNSILSAKRGLWGRRQIQLT